MTSAHDSQPSRGIDGVTSSNLRPSVALPLDWQIQFELCRQLLLAVQTVGEVNSPDPAVGVNLDPESLHVVCAVRSSREVRKIELNLVPSLVQSHRHRADERLHPGGGLVVARPESSPYILVIQDLHLECVVLLHVLDNHHKVGKLDAEGLLGVSGTSDVGSAHIGPDYLQHEGLKFKENSAEKFAAE